MKERVISAIVMLIIFVPLLLIGSWPFYIFITVLGMIAIYELLRLKKNLPLVIKIITYLLTAFIILSNVFASSLLIAFDYRILTILILFYLLMLVFINNQEKYNYKDAFYLMGITLFIGISFNNFLHIRNKDIYLLIYLLLITTVTDSFALFTGKVFGKHKVAPLISPNKTVEGCIGGSLVGCIVASLFYIFMLDYQNVYLVIILTLLLTIIGQLGDLIKSSIKRHEGIKDFSNLIPGHGGVLDRLDSIIFVTMTYILISGLF